MKKLLTLIVLITSIPAFAQVSLKTRTDSVRAINNRQITTSTPPNLVYPVQVGAKTDSLCAIIKSLIDSVNGIASTTYGLQQVTDNLDTTNNAMIVGDGFLRTIHNSQYVSTNFRTGGTLLTYLGYVGSVPSLYLKDVASANGAKLISGSLTAPRFCYLPNEGISGGGLNSTLVLHHTKDAITVDATGTGDSTRIGQGFLDVYAPPVASYNLVGGLRPDGLFIGQRNTAHTHQDGVSMYYSADGSNYYDTIPNKSGTIALTSDIAAVTSQPSFQIPYGTGTGLTSNTNFKYDPDNKFSVAGVGSPSSALLSFVWDGAHPKLKLEDSDAEYFRASPLDGTYGIGDALFGGTPIGNGTKFEINDATQLIKLTNIPAYANDAAATLGGLTTGNVYKTTTLGSTFLKIVP